jgi:hypothetical protein
MVAGLLGLLADPVDEGQRGKEVLETEGSR